MKDLFQKFITKYNGMQNVGNTPDNIGQCTGISNIWIVDWLKKSFIWGHAKNWANNYNPNDFEFILNTPDYIPQVGDIICKNNGTYGHVAISTGTGDLHNYEVFEQNVPLGGGCRLHTYKDEYKNVLGGLRSRGNVSDSQNIILAQSDAFIAICVKLQTPANRDVVLAELDKLVAYEDMVVQKDHQLEEAAKKTTELQKTISDKQGELETLQENLRILKNQADQAVEDNKILSYEVKELRESYQQNPVLQGWRKIIYEWLIRG